MCNLTKLRREVNARGLDWAAVQAAYSELKQTERDQRERPNEVRQAAWCMAVGSTPASWPFWRHGFEARWGRKLARGSDYSCVPGYDEIAQQIAGEFPEYDTDDGTERLFDFLFSPYDRMPDRETIYRKAMDLVEWESSQS